MASLGKIKKHYDQIIKKTLADNKEILIDSFVEYYGEEYRQIIEERYEKIIFVYYINWDIIKKVLSNVDFYKKERAKYREIEKVYEANKLVERMINHLKKEDKRLLNLVGKSKDVELDENILQIFSNSSLVTAGRKDDIFVVFHMLIFSEEAIIHEISHALMRQNYADLYTDEGTFKMTFAKFGAEIYESEKLFEELINDKSSKEITKIFKRRGGDLTSFCFDVPLRYYYKENFYLVDEFYEEFKELLKAPRITLNKNGLVKRIGEDNYKEYCKLIKDYYSTDISVIVERKEEGKNKAHELVEKMKQNVKNDHDFTQREMNAFYQELEENGYEVTLLNTEDNEKRSRIHKKIKSIS